MIYIYIDRYRYRYIDIDIVIHDIYNGISLNHKKEWNLAFVKIWMDLEYIMLSEIRQRETNTI